MFVLPIREPHLTLLFAVLPFAATGTAQAFPTLPPHGHVYNGDSPRRLDSGTAKGALNADGGEFVNMASGKCLDADLGTVGQQGTIVQVWSCGGAPNQIWWFEFTS